MKITENKIEKFRKFNPKFLDWFFSTQSSEEYEKALDARKHQIANQREFYRKLSQRLKEDPPKYEQYIKKRKESAKISSHKHHKKVMNDPVLKQKYQVIHKKYYYKNREKILQKRKERKERRKVKNEGVK